MSDDLRDRFDSDEEYEKFKNSYSDYKNNSGMFDTSSYLMEVIEFQKLLYDSFVVGHKKIIPIPEKYMKADNISAYIFYFKTLNSKDTVMLLMN